MISIALITSIWFLILLGGALWIHFTLLNKNALQRELDRERNENSKDFLKRIEEKLDGQNKILGLTNRENEINKLVVLQGLTTNQIADLLFLSKHTVQNHKKNFKNKLGKKNAQQELIELLKAVVKKGEVK